jgi:hypothetical protein
VFIVSTHRIVKVSQTGLFARVVTEAGVEGIRDASWMKKGILGHAWNYGTVIMNVSNTPQPIMAFSVPQPKQVHALVTDMMDLAKMRGSKGVAQEHVAKADRVKKMLDGLSEDELRALERKLVREDREQTIDRLFQSPKAHEDVEVPEVGAPESDEDGEEGMKEPELSVKKFTTTSLKEIHD